MSFPAAEHPFEDRVSAVMVSAITYQPQPEIATSPASRLLMFNVVEVAGSPEIPRSPMVTSSNVPGCRLRIIKFPPVTSSKIALSPEAPAAEDVELPPG